MKIIKLSDPAVERETISVLKKGGLVVVPSDTVYGLSVDATNSDAVKKLIAFKSRVPGKAISVFVGSLENAHKYVNITSNQQELLQSMLPGRFTVVLPSKHKVGKDLEAENGTLGIRVPNYPFINKLVKDFSKPLTATSANQAGRSPHYSIESLLNAITESKKKMIDLVVDAGKLPRNKPSTVVDFTTENFEILRAGEVNIPMSQSKELTSTSEQETQHIAQKLLREKLEVLTEKPIVFMLYGDLGAGKTVFVKGLGKALGVNNIISPTFVITYEYDVCTRYVDMLHHFDLYRIEEAEEFNYLGIEEILKPRTVIAIEWSEKSKKILESLNKKAEVIHISISHVDDSQRKLIIY